MIEFLIWCEVDIMKANVLCLCLGVACIDVYIVVEVIEPCEILSEDDIFTDDDSSFLMQNFKQDELPGDSWDDDVISWNWISDRLF